MRVAPSVSHHMICYNPLDATQTLQSGQTNSPAALYTSVRAAPSVSLHNLLQPYATQCVQLQVSHTTQSVKAICYPVRVAPSVSHHMICYNPLDATQTLQSGQTNSPAALCTSVRVALSVSNHKICCSHMLPRHHKVGKQTALLSCAPQCV